MLPGLVERHLLIKHAFNRSHHGFKAMHPKGKGFVWLIVSLLFLVKRQNALD